LGGVIFETAQRLRGYYNLLLDFSLNKEFAHYLLDQITAMCAHNCALLARAGADIIVLGDDVGEPTKMLISPQMWREFLKPRLARIIAAIREEKTETIIMYHSDGYIEPIIPELIEIGVDVLEPVQPDFMDPAKLKATYGDRLAFWGTVGVQTTWSATMATEAIRQEVRQRIATVGQGGGLLIAPAYDVEPDVPWQNIQAFLQAVEEFG
jgi:uroporphyrinogen decarboxylase